MLTYLVTKQLLGELDLALFQIYDLPLHVVYRLTLYNFRVSLSFFFDTFFYCH